jgi:hypothetical protein
MRRLCRKQHVQTTAGSCEMLQISAAHLVQQGKVHFRFRDSLGSSGPVSVSFDGHYDGLGPTSRHRTGTVGVVIQPQAHSDDLCLHFADRRKDVWVKWVGDAVTLISCNDDFLKVISTICGKDERSKRLITQRREKTRTIDSPRKLSMPPMCMCSRFVVHLVHLRHYPFR